MERSNSVEQDSECSSTAKTNTSQRDAETQDREPLDGPPHPNYRVHDLVCCAVCHEKRAPSSFTRHCEACEENLAKSMDRNAAKAYADEVSTSEPTPRVTQFAAPNVVVVL